MINSRDLVDGQTFFGVVVPTSTKSHQIRNSDFKVFRIIANVKNNRLLESTIHSYVDWSKKEFKLVEYGKKGQRFSFPDMYGTNYDLGSWAGKANYVIFKSEAEAYVWKAKMVPLAVRTMKTRITDMMSVIDKIELVAADTIDKIQNENPEFFL